MKPVCIHCSRFFRMKRSGFYFLEGMPRAGSRLPKPGTSDAANWQPYKIWSGDVWECDGCGVRIISGVAAYPIAEHFQDNFEDEVSRLNARQFQVNDCG